MRDAGAAGADHFIARADHVPSGAQFDLRRPVQPGQHVGDIDGDGGERPHGAIERHRALRPHAVEAHRAGGDRHRVAVLQPQHHALVRPRCRQAGVAVGRPGVGVVRAGEAGAPVGRISIQRVFHDIVPRGPDRVQEQLAREFRQAEARAHGAAVDREPAGPVRQRLFPGGERGAGGIEQPQPEADRPGAVARPVVGGHEAGGKPVLVAEEGEVGGEVQPVQVAPRVGQQGRRQLRLVQAAQGGTGRQQGSDAGRRAPGVEGGDQHAARLGARQVNERAGGQAGTGPADRSDVVDIERYRPRQVGIHCQQRGGEAVGVIERDRAFEAVEQEADRLRRQRVRQGLVDDVAAGTGVEGFDL